MEAAIKIENLHKSFGKKKYFTVSTGSLRQEGYMALSAITAVAKQS